MMMSLLAGAAMAVGAACTATSPAHTVALVELYTSQGCSSCPPADRWLSQLQTDQRAVPLALHVAYWDTLGWKDPFARREFTDRQRARAAAQRSRSVYTPGVFIHGLETPRWHDGSSAQRTVAEVNRRPAAAQIELSARRLQDELEVTVQSRAAGKPQARLQLALAQDGHVTRVTAGENRNEVLGNDHVVRAWPAPLPLGTQTLRLPLPLPTGSQASGGALTLVAIVEDGTEVLQVLGLPLARCSP